MKTFREKLRQYKTLPRHRRAAFGFTVPGCFEVGFGSFGPAIEELIDKKLGVAAHMKFCWKDTEDTRCVDKEAPLDKTKFLPTVEDPTNNDRSKHPKAATLKPGIRVLLF